MIMNPPAFLGIREGSSILYPPLSFLKAHRGSSLGYFEADRQPR